MVYFSGKNNFHYNKTTYYEGQPIADFGSGKYDDILLDRGDVVSDGSGTGVEDKIAHQKARRSEMWTNYDGMLKEEENFTLDYAKYDGDREVENRIGQSR